MLGLILEFAQNGWQLMRRLADPQLEGRRTAQREPAVDTRVSPRSLEQEIPGTFISPADPEPQPEADSSGRYFPGVMPSYLRTVRDDSPFLRTEHDAWFNLLDVLNKADLKELKPGFSRANDVRAVVSAVGRVSWRGGHPARRRAAVYRVWRRRTITGSRATFRFG